MDLIKGELRNHLDPTAVQILKKRLVSGKITPQVFKDILRRQMVKYYFQSHRHPLIKSWKDWRGSTKRRQDHGSATLQTKNEKFEFYEHKRF